MISIRLAVALCAAGAAAGCSRPITNTVPAPIRPTDPVRYYELEIPAGLEIRGVSFDATTFTVPERSFLSDKVVGTSVGGRAFLQISAVHKDTGEQYLLIYEDIVRRKQPVHIIHFQPIQEGQIPLRSP